MRYTPRPDYFCCRRIKVLLLNKRTLGSLRLVEFYPFLDAVGLVDPI